MKNALMLALFSILTACGSGTVVILPTPTPSPVATPTPIPTPTPGPNSAYIVSPIDVGSWVTRVSVMTKDIPTNEIAKVSFYRDSTLVTETILSDANGAFNYDFTTSMVQCGVYNFIAKATMKIGLILSTGNEVLTLYPTTTVNFTPVTGAKTYVAFDAYADGSIVHSGRAGNGNLGNSAQTGADCCRPDAAPTITAWLPDFNPHRVDVYAYDSSGNPMNGNHPIATFAISKQVCHGV